MGSKSRKPDVTPDLCHSEKRSDEESAVPSKGRDHSGAALLNSVAPSLLRSLRQDGKSPSKHNHPPKRRGELAELAFMRKAIGLGFGVAKPWGDSDRYDFILDSGRRLWRVQVRSTEYQTHRGYAVHTYVYVKKQMVALTSNEVDAIVAYIVPLDLWYVVPIQFADCKNLWFYPHGSKKGSRFERFREAWGLLV
jgi:hypothetical protein